MALDIQQRKAKHGDRGNDPDTETESSLDSTDTPLYKWGDYRTGPIENQGMASRDQNLKHAQKLMALYAQQLAALDKHRGKGQQKVTVEYVNVEP